jgi:hypothetical protein
MKSPPVASRVIRNLSERVLSVVKGLYGEASSPYFLAELNEFSILEKGLER